MKIGGILTIILLLLPLPLAGQDARGDPRPPLPGPVEVLLSNRATLSLTATQVAQLEAIERDMEAANRSLVLRLIELRREMRARPRLRDREATVEQRAEMRRLMDEARPLYVEIRANNRSAMGRVGDVLTPAQKEQVRELIRERINREGRGGRSPGRVAGPR